MSVLHKAAAGVLLAAAVAAFWTWVPAPLSAQNGPVELSGRLTVQWGDPARGAAPDARLALLLTDDAGVVTALLATDELLAEAGGLVALQGLRVRVTGLPVGTSPEAGELPSVRVTSLRLDEPAPESGVRAVTGPQKWVTILCRFSDSTGTTPKPLSYFTGLIGTTKPGFNHYWRTLSFDQINTDGSAVSDWRNLPSPRADYFDIGGNANLSKLASDCTALHDPAVDFSAFVGFNMGFNQDLDCCAWGGGMWMTLDGQTRAWRTTWLPPWGYNNQSVVAHEMGHGFGFPHSSGPYGQTYDSAWDVMSNAWAGDSDPTFGVVGQGTISYNKDLAGWIPGPRVFTFSGGSSTITLELLSSLAAGVGTYMMARVPIPGTADYYTVEARRFDNYDVSLPFQAVVIHHVSPGRSRPAWVVDATNNNNPNDEGAAWLPGETYTDEAAGLSIAVDAATPTGWTVTITDATLHRLTVTRKGQGTVTSSPAGITCPGDCAHDFADGTAVTLTPAPAANWAFLGWTGAADCSDGVVTMTGDLACSATFTPIKNLTVALTGTGTGTVTSNPAGIACPGDCAEAYAAKTAVALTPAAAGGSVFAGWLGALDCRDGAVTMAGHRTCQARFELLRLLTVSVVLNNGAAGTVSSAPAGIACGVDCTESYANGTRVKLTAAPGAGSTFSGWTGACTHKRRVCVVPMTDAMSATATFTR